MRIANTLAAEQNPVIVSGAGDQSGVMVKGRLMLEEETFEEGKVFFGVGNVGGGAVLGGREMVIE